MGLTYRRIWKDKTHKPTPAGKIILIKNSSVSFPHPSEMFHTFRSRNQLSYQAQDLNKFLLPHEDRTKEGCTDFSESKVKQEFGIDSIVDVVKHWPSQLLVAAGMASGVRPVG